MSIDIRKIVETNPAADFSEPLLQEPIEEKPRYIHLEREQLQQDKEAEYVRDRAEASSRSQILRADINKAVKAGADPVSILLQALECIALMTGDTTIHTQNERILREKYPKTP